MKLTSATITDHKQIKTYLFLKQVTAVNSLNDTKTISVGVSYIFKHFYDVKHLSICKIDANIFPIEIKLTTKDFDWRISYHGKRSSYPNKNSLISKYSKELQYKISNGLDVQLPVIACYFIQKQWIEEHLKGLDTIKPDSVTLGYKNYNNAYYKAREFIRWFKTMTFAEYQRKTTMNILKAVKVAIAKYLQINFKDIYYDLVLDDIMVKLSENLTPLRKINVKYRNDLNLILDLAYRCITLNPSLGVHGIDQAIGIVFIANQDVDMNRVSEIFPKLQFIVCKTW